ncbi:MAG: O-antigen ligase family protein [Amoebophilaceae bacterium]|nr:O-antigen ligase family protein [Amoebophilaceae bacterium]
MNKYNFFVAVLIGGSIPLSTSVENLTLVLVPLAVFFTASMRKNLVNALQFWTVRLSLLTYLVFMFGVIWSSAPLHDVSHMLVKMITMLVLPFAVCFYQDERLRKISLWMFFCVTTISLILSYVAWLFNHPILHGARYYVSNGAGAGADNWCPFRAHAYHCYFIGLTMCMLIYKLLNKQVSDLKLKVLAVVYIVLGGFNIFYMVSSRTGQLSFIMMIFVLLITWQFKRGILIFVGCILLALPAVYLTSNAVQSKIKQARMDLIHHQEGVNQGNSIGLRLTFHKYAKLLISEKPILGHGTGSYSSEYARVAVHDTINTDGNPHSDYLWFGVELGYVGMGLLIMIFSALAYDSYFLQNKSKTFGWIIAVTYLIICTQNSFYTDSVTGIAFLYFVALIFSSDKLLKLRI